MTTSLTTSQVQAQLRLQRKIEGCSAVLLPFSSNGDIDYDSYEQCVQRTFEANLTPAVNMDTGYANLLSAVEKRQVLQRVQNLAAGRRFIAGAYIEGQDGEVYSLYARAVEEIQSYGGTPIIFQSSKLKALRDADKVGVYARIGQQTTEFLGFELGEMFLPFGEIYALQTFQELMEIPQLKGIKHSSLNRILELQRLELRDRLRPDFKIYTGNDLAIDMVMYGSDYLLGLSAFAPEAFGLRDQLWQRGDARFYALNDLLQYLGFLAFRPPVPLYKHNCAQFLHLRGRIRTSLPHPRAASRPDSDTEILRDISQRLDALIAECTDN
jgi:dihydrodipicolinate synthase/N-acetylneuraminate lyase